MTYVGIHSSFGGKISAEVPEKTQKGEVGKGKECFFIEEREKGRKRKDEF